VDRPETTAMSATRLTAMLKILRLIGARGGHDP